MALRRDRSFGLGRKSLIAFARSPDDTAWQAANKEGAWASEMGPGGRGIARRSADRAAARPAQGLAAVLGMPLLLRHVLGSAAGAPDLHDRLRHVAVRIRCRVRCPAGDVSGGPDPRSGRTHHSQALQDPREPVERFRRLPSDLDTRRSADRGRRSLGCVPCEIGMATLPCSRLWGSLGSADSARRRCAERGTGAMGAGVVTRMSVLVGVHPFEPHRCSMLLSAAVRPVRNAGASRADERGAGPARRGWRRREC